MKKILVLLLVMIFAAVGMIGCSSGEATDESNVEIQEENNEVEEFVIVATTFPQYDWTRQILGSQIENVELILLQDTVVDLHNFQPTVSDIATISTADMFIYVGGKSDGWVEEALRSAQNEELIAINLMDALAERIDLLEVDHHHHDHVCDVDHHHDHDCDDDHDHDHDCDDDHHHDHDCDDDHDHGHDHHHDHNHEHVHDHHHSHDYDHEHDHHHDHEHDHDHDYDYDHDSHDHDYDHDHDHDHGHEHDDDCDVDHHHHHEDEYDEHIWLSLRNARILSSYIAEALSVMDPANADYYQSNLESYQAELATLDGQFVIMVTEAATNVVVFGDRFPFRYLMNDYHLRYYAAFDGCSAETEASFSTIVFLVGIVDEMELSHILVIDGSDFSIAETIRDATEAGDQEILVLDSMQSVTSSDVEGGVTFLSIMESNLEVLRTALD